MKKIFSMICLLLILSARFATAQNDLSQKLMMGYQGWFLCQGDNSAPNEWRHWFQSTTDPSASQLNVDLWPDMTEYTTTYATSMNYPNGTNARLFSSHDASTTNLHFKWMQDYNIYGVYLQRFLGEAVNDQRFFKVRNDVLQNVINASATYGRHFSIMYDISGVPDDGTLYNKLVSDWEYLVNTYNVTNKPGYVKQNGLPVIAIWGIGFSQRGLNPATFEALVNYFHNTAAPQYRAYIVGGVPGQWRTLDGDSESDPRWLNIYHSLDMISPWAVGRYVDNNSADNWKNQRVVPDLADCNSVGKDYMPVIFPGFSWYNMHDGASTSPLNQIPRAGGNFYWRQAYNVISAGSKFVYVAMFDEADEGTAMFKVAPNASSAPAGASFVTLDKDGTTLPSDWYLRLANETQKMLSGTSPVTSTIPISPNGSAPVITSNGTASGFVNANFNYTITASNSPTSFGASGLPSGLVVNTSTGVISGTPNASGTFNATITASNASGTGSKALTITITALDSQTPYPNGTPWPIPGTIEAENFDVGGEGIAYHDNDAINSGGQGRTGDGVDTETCSEGGLNVGWTNTGEWLEYTVNVAATGNYNVDVRTASLYAGGTLHIEFNGVDKTGLFTTTNTGAWQTWTTISKTGIALTAGQQVMRIYFDNANFNLNKVTFTSAGVSVTGVTVSPTSATLNVNATQQLTATVAPSNATNKNVTWSSSNASVATVSSSGLVTAVGAGTATITVTTQDGGKTASSSITVNSSNTQTAYPNGTPWAIPGTIEVENYDNGGEGVAYHDNEAANQGGQYRTTEGVDVEACSEGGYNVGWTNTGEWLEYTVNVATTGNYNVDVRQASTLAGGTFHIEFNGVDKTGLFTTTNTGAWQTWTTISKTGIALTAGTQVMRIYFDNANFNLNKVTFTSASGNVAVTGVSVSPTSATINAGSTQQLTATVAPSNATNQSVTWSSTNTGVATVSSSGVVTGVAAGSATITVTTVDGGKTATSAITVNVPAGTISCKKTSVAITVNGTLSETSWSSSVVNNSITKTTTGAPNNTATFGVLWDNTNLYIGAKILDANLFSDSPNQWDDDAVEIYIDANNNKSASYDGLDNQIIKNYNQSGVFTKLTISGLQHAWAAISGGYSVEIAVPWSALGISAPAQGTTIGFDIGYDDDDNGGTRDGQAVWNGDVNNYQNTSKFGSVVLSNTTAREAVEEIVSADEEVTYWPTVVENELHIRCDGTYRSVEVIDMLGKVHYQNNNLAGKTAITMDLSHLRSGMHLVRMSNSDKSKIFRVIKR